MLDSSRNTTPDILVMVWSLLLYVTSLYDRILLCSQMEVLHAVSHRARVLACAKELRT